MGKSFTLFFYSISILDSTTDYYVMSSISNILNLSSHDPLWKFALVLNSVFFYGRKRNVQQYFKD